MKCPKALLDGNSAGDYSFIHGDKNVTTNKVYYDDCASKIVFTLQESQEPAIDDTIEQVRTDNLSTVIAARNVDSLPPVKSESKTPEINQQRSRDRFKLPDDQHSQEYDISSQSRESQDYTHKDSVSNTTVLLQQQLRCILQTPAIISKPLSSSFEILEQSNTAKRWRDCTKDTTETSAISAEIEIPRNIPLKWSSTKQPCPRREYHTWKISPGIENDVKCDDASDIRAVQREQSTCYRPQFDGLTCSGSSGNQGSRKPSSCPSSVPRRDFSSKSCTVIHSSVRNIETSRKDLFSANLSTIRLRSTRETQPGRVSLTKLQSFCCDSSKKSSDCEENDGSKSEDPCSRKVAKNHCRDESEKKCEKTRTRRKDTCGRDSGVSSRNGTCEKRRESESESCERYTCPELRTRQCIWETELCPEETCRKRDAKERAAIKDRARSRDPNCSQKQDTDTRCSQRRRSKSSTRRQDCEKPSRVICKDSSKRKNDCHESKSKEKRCVKPEKEQSKCTGKHQRRSESCQKRNSSRSSGNKNCGKVDGKRRYSQQSIFSISRDHRSFSTLIPDIVLDTDVRKTTKALYSSCGKSEKRDLKQGPSCEKQKRKCETTKKDETKRKCVKGPAKCLSRKSIVDKAQTCQSTKAKDEDKKLREPTQKYYNHAEYCANRKIEPITKDKKPIGKAAKEQPSITVKDEKPTEESIKKQIEREYKEIDECKKKGKVIEKKEKKPETTKKAPTEYKPTGLDRVISPCKQEGMKDSKKFASMPNESIFSNFMGIAYKMLNVRSNIINGEIPIIPKDIKLLNVMFDRSFSTTKVSYQDDFAIKRTTDHSKTIQNCSANNSDFIHGDESPNYIEIENDDEEEDDYDWIIGRPTSGIN
ncbi:unnamed protein product [Lasius platythorax]